MKIDLNGLIFRVLQIARTLVLPVRVRFKVI